MCGSGSWRAIDKQSINPTGLLLNLASFRKRGFYSSHDLLFWFEICVPISISLVYLQGVKLVPLCSSQNTKKSHCLDSTRVHIWGGGGSSGHLRTHQPAHPFVQDPAMPPLPPPNTLAQLEEARRRLEEVSKPPKQRYDFSSLPLFIPDSVYTSLFESVQIQMLQI